MKLYVACQPATAVLMYSDATMLTRQVEAYLIFFHQCDSVISCGSNKMLSCVKIKAKAGSCHATHMAFSK